MKPKARKGFIDTDEIARRVGIKRAAAREILEASGLKYYRIGRSFYVAAAEAKTYGSLLKNAKSALAVERADLFKKYARPVPEEFAGLMADRVYLIRCQDFVKIGFSNGTRTRLSTLQMGNPHELKIIAVLPGGEEMEKDLHRRFAEHRHRGEWFRIEGALATYIERLSVDRKSREKHRDDEILTHEQPTFST